MHICFNIIVFITFSSNIIYCWAGANVISSAILFTNNIDEDIPVTNFESGKPTSLRDVRYEEACNRLAVEAVKRGCTDNVTVMIVDIIHPAAVSGVSEKTVVEKSSS